MSRWKMTRNIGRELVTDSARRASRESRAPGSGARRAHQTRCDVRWPQASGRKTYKTAGSVELAGRTRFSTTPGVLTLEKPAGTFICFACLVEMTKMLAA